MTRRRARRALVVLVPLAIAGAELLTSTRSSAQDSGHHPPPARDSARLFAKSCASCHVYPDATLPTDSAWLGQIMETSWSSTPKKAREALRQFLTTNTLQRPRSVSAETAPGDREGKITSDVKAGEVFLRNDEGTLRLRWTKGAEQRGRSVPAGSYRLLGYRLISGDWMVSSTGGRSELSVRAGQSHAVAPSSAIHFKLKARRQGEQIRVQLGIGNGQHMGLSIYRAGKRIPLTYTLLDSEGKELTSGPLGYGWGGGAGASARLRHPGPITVRIDLPEGLPFPIKGATTTSLNAVDSSKSHDWRLLREVALR